MVKDICLVINDTGRDIRIDELWRKYLPDFKRSVESSPCKSEIIPRKNGYTIKSSEFIERWENHQRSNNAELYKRVSLPEDSEKGKELSKKEIDINIGFVICMDENNQLVKESVSKEESKNSVRENESEEELKESLISIVNNRNGRVL